jgi:hypothetical protein
MSDAPLVHSQVIMHYLLVYEYYYRAEICRILNRRDKLYLSLCYDSPVTLGCLD